MPSKSPAQARLMQAAAHNSQFALKTGVPQGVAKDFVKADKAKGGGQYTIPPDFGVKDEEAAEGDPRTDLPGDPSQPDTGPAGSSKPDRKPPPKKPIPPMKGKGGGQFNLPRKGE